MSLILTTETDAEQRMVAATIDQPNAEEGSGYLDKSLISASIAYDGHWSNKRITRVKMCIYKPNDEKEKIRA